MPTGSAWAMGLFTVSHPPWARPPGLGNTAPSEHASEWWEALQRAPSRILGLCSDLGDLPALLPPQSRGLFATTFCRIRECLQAPELSLGGSQDGSQASP